MAVEPVDSTDPASSRVRIMLAQPVAHHVRSDRNKIVIEFDKAPSSTKPYLLRAGQVVRAGRLRRGRAARRPRGAGDPAHRRSDRRARPERTERARAGHGSTGSAVAPAGSNTGLAGLPAARASALPAAFQQVIAPPPPEPPVAPLLAPTTQFTGHPVSLDFQGADLRAVLRTFAEISGLNMVIDPKVTGTVDVALRDVPWDQALDIILRANGLGFRVDGTIVRIAPREVFTAEDKGRSDAASAQAFAGELTVMTKTLSYAKAEEMVALLTKSALSPRGTVQVDSGRTR